MKNLKIKVNSEAESKEIQNILESTGFRKWVGWSELGSIGGFIWTESDMTYCDNRIEYFDESPRKEITLPELRAMVDPLKEYLEKQPDGTYSLVLRGDLCKESDILIPEGAEILTGLESDKFSQVFWKPSLGEVYRDGAFRSYNFHKSMSYEEYKSNCTGNLVLWQREQDQDEPFLTPECTLNDQYAEIEQVRQVEIHGTVKTKPDFNFGAAQSIKDNVNHPGHYTQGKVECIDALESATIGKTGIEAVCVANVIKYLWRYEEKNGLEDVKKAQFYLNRLLATLEN